MTVARKTKEELLEEVEALRKELHNLKAAKNHGNAAEELLKKSEAKYRQLIEATHTGYVIIDERGFVLDANHEYMRMTGHDNIKDITGRNVTEWTADYQKEKNAAAVIKCLKEGYINNLEIDYVDSRGNIVPVEINARLLEEDGASRIFSLCHDITRRKKDEENLLAAQEKLRLIAENARDTIWIMDMDLRYTYMSPYVEHIVGYTPEEYIAKPLEEVMTPASVELCMRVFAEELEIEKRKEKDILRSRIIEVDHISKDGRIIPAEFKLTFIRDEKGNPKGILGFTRDITYRKKIEKEILESEEKYRLVVENAWESIIITQDGKVVFVNRAGIDLIGQTEETLMTTPFTDFIYPDDRGMVIDRHIRRIKGEAVPPIYTFRIVHPDATVRWVEINAVLIQWKGRPATLNFISDITERKATEESLRLSEATYRTLFDTSGTSMIMINEDTIVTLCNREWEKLSGYSKEEMENKKSWTEFVHEEDLKFMRNYHKQRRTGDEGIPRQYEFRFIDRHGKMRNMINTVALIPGSKMSVASQIDITEIKKLEAQLLQAQKMEAIGTLTGGIAHDFNNLLMAIQGLASLMLMSLQSDHPLYGKIKAIEERAITGTSLTRQLLGFARGGTYELKPADMNTILKKTSELFGQTKKEITINRKLQENIWAVEVDTNQMEQVLLNLYLNAWQAMPGGGKLHLETANAQLTEADSNAFGMRPGRYVKISITDTGVGMDDKTRERIFEPFFTTKARGKGTGLGLAMVYGIVKGHNGYINVYSIKGSGATFSIYLPASEKEIPGDESGTYQTVGGTETILLIDDEASIIMVVREMLEALGYCVLTAREGEEAVKIYRAEKDRIALVILDMIMPGMREGEIFDIMRECNRDVKVILSSGYSMNGEASGIIARGCRGFLQKPVNIIDLSKKIREVIET